MAYAFNKLEDYLRGNKQPGGTSVPNAGSSQPKSGAIQGGGAVAKPGQEQTTPVTTSRSILEKNPNYKGEAVSGRILKPATEQAGNIQAGYTGEFSNYANNENTRIENMYQEPQDLPGTVGKAATGDTGATSALAKGLTPQPYVPTQYNVPDPQTLGATQYSRGGNVGTFLQQQSGGKYTPGMGLIDQMAWNRGGGGAQVSKGLGDLQSTTAQGLAALQARTGAGGEFDKLAKKVQDETRAAIRAAIDARQGDLDAAIQEALRNRQSARTADENVDDVSALLAKIFGEETAGLNKDQIALAQGVARDPYMKSSTTEETLDTPEIAQWNALANLENLDPSIAAADKSNPYAVPKTHGTTWRADDAGYRQAIREALKKYKFPVPAQGSNPPGDAPPTGANAPYDIPGTQPGTPGSTGTGGIPTTQNPPQTGFQTPDDSPFPEQPDPFGEGAIGGLGTGEPRLPTDDPRIGDTTPTYNRQPGDDDAPTGTEGFQNATGRMSAGGPATTTNAGSAGENAWVQDVAEAGLNPGDVTGSAGNVVSGDGSTGDWLNVATGGTTGMLGGLFGGGGGSGGNGATVGNLGAFDGFNDPNYNMFPDAPTFEVDWSTAGPAANQPKYDWGTPPGWTFQKPGAQ